MTRLNSDTSSLPAARLETAIYLSPRGKDAPRAVTALGGKYAIKDNREIPDTVEVLWEYEGPTLMIFSQYNANAAPGNQKNSEMILRGTKGTMYLDLNNWEVVPEVVTEDYVTARTPVNRSLEKSYGRIQKPAMEPRTARGSSNPAPHARNFLDCVKSRAKCNCDIETGHLSTASTLIGNVALRTRSFLEWDARAERFTNNEAANRFLQYKYRAPYKLG